MKKKQSDGRTCRVELDGGGKTSISIHDSPLLVVRDLGYGVRRRYLALKYLEVSYLMTRYFTVRYYIQ